MGYGTPDGISNSLTRDLSTWPNMEVFGISCPTASSCAAVGGLNVSHGRQVAALRTMDHGTWGAAHAVLQAQRRSDSNFEDVSCFSAGNCLAVGSGVSNSNNGALIVLEHDGVWGAPHVYALPDLRSSQISLQVLRSTACSLDGTCWALDGVVTKSGEMNSYALGESAGHWLVPVRLAANLPLARVQLATSISCSSMSSCTVAGLNVAQGSHRRTYFTQSERNRIWDAARLIPTVVTDGDKAVLGIGNFWYQRVLACTAPSSCLFGGRAAKPIVGVVDQEISGKWIAQLSGVGTAGAHVNSEVRDVACASAQLCVVTGTSSTSSSDNQLFVQVQHRHSWGRPVYYSAGRSSVPLAVGCPRVSTCYVLGESEATANHYQAVFVSMSRSGWSKIHFLGLNTTVNYLPWMRMSCSPSACWVAGVQTVAPGKEVTVVFRLAQP